MSTIPEECRRMADIYRQFCLELGVPSNSPPPEVVGRMSISIFIQGARGAGPDPAPAGGGGHGARGEPAPPPTAESSGSTKKEVSSTKRSGHETPAAADNRPATENQKAYLRVHTRMDDETIKAMKFSEASRIIGDIKRGE